MAVEWGHYERVPKLNPAVVRKRLLVIATDVIARADMPEGSITVRVLCEPDLARVMVELDRLRKMDDRDCSWCHFDAAGLMHADTNADEAVRQHVMNAVRELGGTFEGDGDG